VNVSVVTKRDDVFHGDGSWGNKLLLNNEPTQLYFIRRFPSENSRTPYIMYGAVVHCITHFNGSGYSV
jgi:hypothetical protein